MGTIPPISSGSQFRPNLGDHNWNSKVDAIIDAYKAGDLSQTKELISNLIKELQGVPDPSGTYYATSAFIAMTNLDARLKELPSPSIEDFSKVMEDVRNFLSKVEQ